MKTQPRENLFKKKKNTLGYLASPTNATASFPSTTPAKLASKLKVQQVPRTSVGMSMVSQTPMASGAKRSKMFPTEGLFGALSAYPSEIKQASKLKFSVKKNSVSGQPGTDPLILMSQQTTKTKRPSHLAVQLGTRSERSQERAIKYTAIKSINLDNSPDNSGRLQTEQAYKAMAPSAFATGRLATEPMPVGADSARFKNIQRHSIDLAVDEADEPLAHYATAQPAAADEAEAMRASHLRNSQVDDGNESNYESAQEDDDYRYGDYTGAASKRYKGKYTQLGKASGDLMYPETDAGR